MDAALNPWADQPIQGSGSGWLYSVVPEELYHTELGKYHTYSIQITLPEGNDILHDVSVSKETAEHIVERLNYYQISPQFLYDIVIDMLP